MTVDSNPKIDDALARAFEDPTVPDSEIRYKAWKVQNLAYRAEYKDRTVMTMPAGTSPSTVVFPGEFDLNQINEMVADIPGLFEEVLRPQPDSFDGPGEHCVNAGKCVLTSHRGSFVDAADKIKDEFTGDTSTVFFQTYVGVHDLISGNQAAVADALYRILQAQKGIHKAARVAAKEAADKAIKALEGLLTGDGFSKSDLKVTIAILGTVAAVLSTVASAGALAPEAAAADAALWTALAGDGLATVANAGTAGVEISDRAIAGSSVEEVLDSLRKVLKQNKADVETEEKRLVAAIRKVRGEVWNEWKGNGPDARKWSDTGEPMSMMVVKRPAIADLPDKVVRSRSELEKRGILGVDERG